MKTLEEIKGQADKFLPRNYDRFPVAFVGGNGSYLEDTKGRKYIDMLAGYASLNFGHNNPVLRHAWFTQFGRVGLVTGNFYNDTAAEFAERLANFTGLSGGQVLLANGGAEAVEKAIKICRRWAYRVKKVSPYQAEIIVTYSNFHGRTYGVLSASRVTEYKEDFGPFLPGFKFTEFGNADDLEHIIDGNKAAFLVEPIQGEGGFIFPPEDYLKKAEKICRKNNVLFVLDEIPTAFGRIGNPFPHFHYGVDPDLIILGKALSGGACPVSAVVGKKEVMSVLDPGSDGSTFGGNPLACALGLAAIQLTEDQQLAEKVKVLGSYFLKELKNIKSEAIKEVRGLGLFIGVELNKPFVARLVCEELIKSGVVTAPTRENVNVIRFTPPLTITKGEIDDALEVINHVLGIIGTVVFGTEIKG